MDALIGEMAPPNDILRVGIEAFTLLEECLKQKTRPPLHHRHPRQFASAATPSNHAKEAIDSYQVAQTCGGVLIVDYRNKKPLLPHRMVN
ncbi:hypothetical protein SO802_033257 [Lithocarpus litseifolius]|uniref:Uncharacterized protein n=1 Tax=Lithocarpus litseifolius TaxID=425828 RepID=A0AAW2BEH6_9ROSI